MVDQGDVQYFIGVQLDGTERVRDAAAKDGAMLVCFYLNGDQIYMGLLPQISQKKLE